MLVRCNADHHENTTRNTRWSEVSMNQIYAWILQLPTEGIHADAYRHTKGLFQSWWLRSREHTWNGIFPTQIPWRSIPMAQDLFWCDHLSQYFVPQLCRHIDMSLPANNWLHDKRCTDKQVADWVVLIHAQDQRVAQHKAGVQRLHERTLSQKLIKKQIQNTSKNEVSSFFLTHSLSLTHALYLCPPERCHIWDSRYRPEFSSHS